MAIGTGMKLSLWLAGIISWCLVSTGQADEGLEFFESHIRPLLIEHCYECHSGAKSKGGLSLDSQAGWSAGGESGPAIVPGKPEDSLLMHAVRQNGKASSMPPDKKLTDRQIALLTEWVTRGAPDPRNSAVKIGGMTVEEARSWWSFQPVPAIQQPLTSADIDHEIDQALHSAGLSAAAPADRLTLIRRAAFDLTGLPPTPEEVETFLRDDDPSAVAKLIDRLLEMPQYGEQWGRHWLDIVRYADSLDSRGSGNEGDILDAWRYRDWVVNALNRDLPYDQFITHQIAGDLLATETWDPDLVVATGVYAIGNWGNGDADKEKLHTDIVDDQIDVTSRAFLGLTLSCARCHDHKFDALTTRDYYGMAGIFFSSHILDEFTPKGAGEKIMRIPLLSPAEMQSRSELQQQLAELDRQLSEGLAPLTRVRSDVAGIAGLFGWDRLGVDNPSVAINTTAEPVAFSTIKLPARAISLHPGPQVPVSASWRSPVTGSVQIQATLIDVDPNCGDGIAWALRHGASVLQTGEFNNGGRVEIPSTTVSVQTGDLLQLVIRPRAEYTCDSTQVEFIIRDDAGTTWSLHEALVSQPQPNEESVWWLCAGEGATLKRDDPAQQALIQKRQAIETQLGQMNRYAHGLQDGGIPKTSYAGVHDAAIHKRGRYDTLGDVVPRAMPALLTSKQPQFSRESGRRELTAWIASADNPLTARVMVNRIWQHHFGHGLVRTTNNFGKLGTPPSHPVLLDKLAAEFVRSGWSIKHLHRLIMGTAAYQRSSQSSPQADQIDPDNRLLSHQQYRRLSAEELRDTLLMVSGRLDWQLGGKATAELTGPRRTLYLSTVRSDRSSYQALFDGADSTVIVEQRTEATTAPQSLFLLNHPLVLEQAERLTAMVMQQPDETVLRLHRLWRQVFQAAPTPAEQAWSQRVLGPEPDVIAWTTFCQMLLCSNRLTYVD